jgi:hypothetical protein
LVDEAAEHALQFQRFIGAGAGGLDAARVFLAQSLNPGGGQRQFLAPRQCLCRGTAGLFLESFSRWPQATSAFCGSPLRVNHPEEDRAVGFVNGHDDLVGQ